MVGNLTLGKKRYEDIESEVAGILGRLAILQVRLVELIDDDAEAFIPLAEAYKMPKGSPNREDAIQNALIAANEVPLEIMRTVLDVLHECDFLARYGSAMAISDAGASALMCKAAIISASLNVYINCKSMKDADLANEHRSIADRLIEEGAEMSDSIYEYVAADIGAPVDL